MIENNPHNRFPLILPQRNFDISIISQLNESYKLWHDFLPHLPRLTRYSLGTKIDNTFTDCLELALLAGYTAKENKKIVVDKLSVKFDLLKFFFKLLWEIKALDGKKFSTMSGRLAEIGKMIGGWMKDTQIKTPPKMGENE